MLRNRLPFRRRPVTNLSTEQLEQWDQQGFLVLPKFFDDDELDALDTEVERYWHDRSADNPLVIDMIDGELSGQRLHMRTLDPVHRNTPHKLNDLFLESEACRTLVLDERLVSRLRELIHDEPVAINSLNFAKGSQQEPHFDTYFMPPPIENQMVVSSICFEDTHPDAGPLVYYPGSHRIPPFRFAEGRLSVNGDDMTDAKAHILDRIDAEGLELETFIGSRGDVFLWHAQLYHGGSPIVDHSRTRRSLVTHYWGRDGITGDIRACTTGGLWYARNHPDVPA